MAGDESFVVLGERLSLELVNTAPAGTGRIGDVLADPDAAIAWVDAVAAAMQGESVPRLRAVSANEFDALIEVRGAIEQIFAGSPRPSSLAVINRYESEASPSWSLNLAPSGALVVQRRLWGDGVAAILGLVAADCVDLVRTGAVNQIRRCAGPDCSLRFLVDHHRRSFCRASCSHRARQAAYYRRQRARQG